MAGGRRSVIAGYARREQASLTVRVVTAVLEGGDVMRGGRDGQDGRDEGLAAAEVGVVTPYSAQAALLRELLQVP